MKRILCGLLAGGVIAANLTMPVLAATNYLTDFASTSTTTYQHKNDCDTDVISVFNENSQFLFTATIFNDTVFTTDYLNLRTVPTIDSTPQFVLAPNTELTRVGNGYQGWDIVELENEIYYVYDEYISEDPVDYQEDTDMSISTLYSAESFRYNGVINWNGYRWTWYSEKILPGGGLNIPGRHIDENGYVCDENDNICLASNDYAKGTLLQTPFGKWGKVYDCGCASGTLDVYTSW